jgi:hypothetical protein
MPNCEKGVSDERQSKPLAKAAMKQGPGSENFFFRRRREFQREIAREKCLAVPDKVLPFKRARGALASRSDLRSTRCGNAIDSASQQHTRINELDAVAAALPHRLSVHAETGNLQPENCENRLS